MYNANKIFTTSKIQDTQGTQHVAPVQPRLGRETCRWSRQLSPPPPRAPLCPILPTTQYTHSRHLLHQYYPMLQPNIATVCAPAHHYQILSGVFPKYPNLATTNLYFSQYSYPTYPLVTNITTQYRLLLTIAPETPYTDATVLNQGCDMLKQNVLYQAQTTKSTH